MVVMTPPDSAPERDPGATNTMRIAFQAERGAFSEEAIIACWGPDVELVPQRECMAVARRVEAGHADAGVLPLENSLAGTVHLSYDALLACGSLHATGEVVLRIRHYLLAPAGASLRTLRQVESHPIAPARCRRFLDQYPELEVRPAYDTAGAAQVVAEAKDPSRAVIASLTAAGYYGLDMIAGDIQDRDDNQTRLPGRSPAHLLRRRAGARDRCRLPHVARQTRARGRAHRGRARRAPWLHGGGARAGEAERASGIRARV